MGDERSSSERPLLVCAGCGSDLVFPVEQSAPAADRCDVELRCPDCGWEGERSCDEADLDRLDRELSRAHAEIRGALGRLETLHMEQWADAFACALELDLIGPDDF
jgi:hypothetical protein